MIWDITAPEFPELKNDISCDVLVIGGGMAGVLCALFLQQRGVNTVLVEGKKIGSGITKNTTAVITAQHDILYSRLINENSKVKAQGYLDANLWAVKKFRELSTKYPCDFEIKPSVIYSSTDTRRMREEVDALKSLGFKADFVRDIPLPVKIAGGVRFPDMAQFHPLKFLFAVAKGLQIYENTFVTKVKGRTAFTESCKINAKKIIIATHFPFINRCGLYFLKLYQARSFVLAIENAAQIGGTFVDDGSGFYFRNYGNLLLIGGGDRRTGKEDGGFEPLRRFAKDHYPDSPQKHAFATEDCMSLDGIPYIGRYSPLMPDIYVATGFNEWGMTSSMISARILCGMILKKEDKLAEVFSPQRSMLKKQLFVNLGETVSNFVQPTKMRCSHLGCALKYNSDENSWDCPCHGSRFAHDGKLIDNPAMKDVFIKGHK